MTTRTVTIEDDESPAVAAAALSRLVLNHRISPPPVRRRQRRRRPHHQSHGALMSKPTIRTGPAAAYDAADERTVEFSTDNGGGLINVRVTAHGRVLVSVYRCDPTVDIAVGDDDAGHPTPVYRKGRLLGPTVGEITNYGTVNVDGDLHL